MQFAHAKWEVTPSAKPHRVEGKCQKCGATVPAINLELKRLPFGRGEQWRCKGGC
jgi:hypothetical protein